MVFMIGRMWRHILEIGQSRLHVPGDGILGASSSNGRPNYGGLANASS